jgi:hypothetical protein
MAPREHEAPKTDPSQIRNIVNEIMSSDVQNKEEHFAEKYEDFSTNYPVLYKTVCSGGNTEHLEFMLGMLDQMNKKQKTQHDASVAVGQLLFDKYVEPRIQK